jgi:hypothetical protein
MTAPAAGPVFERSLRCAGAQWVDADGGCLPGRPEEILRTALAETRAGVAVQPHVTHACRSSSEPCLLALDGNKRRLDASPTQQGTETLLLRDGTANVIVCSVRTTRVTRNTSDLVLYKPSD